MSVCYMGARTCRERTRSEDVRPPSRGRARHGCALGAGLYLR